MELEPRVSTPTRAAWLAGSAPETLKNTSWDLFVLFYYSQVLGMRPALIGAALAIILVLDSFVDPYVGALSDSLRRAPLGRRHTLMLAAVLPFGAGFAAVFAPPAGLGEMQLFAWLLGFGALARIGISFYTVPALAVGVELSRDPVERTRLVALRNVGGNIGIICVTVLAFRVFFSATPEFPKGQLNPVPYPAFGTSFALLAMALMLIGILGTYGPIRATERREAAARAPAPRRAVLASLAASARAAWHSTPNVHRLLVLSFSLSIINSLMMALTLHLSTYLWEFTGAQTERLLLFSLSGSLAGYVVAARVVPRFERRGFMAVCVVGFFLGMLLAILLPVLGLAAAPGSPALAWTVSLLRFAGGICFGLYLVASGDLSADISDEHQVNTGEPQQGTVFSMIFLGMQAAGAVSGIAAGAFLDLIAFPVGVPAAEMPPGKIESLAYFVCAVILLGSLLLVAVIRAFDVSPAKQAEIRRRLTALRAGEPLSATGAAPAPTAAGATGGLALSPQGNPGPRSDPLLDGERS